MGEQQQSLNSPEKNSNPMEAEEEPEFPQDLYCPIDYVPFSNPVKIPSGKTYNRNSILTHFKIKYSLGEEPNCPLTNLLMPSSRATIDYEMRRNVQKFLDQNPSLKSQYKLEEPVSAPLRADLDETSALSLLKKIENANVKYRKQAQAISAAKDAAMQLRAGLYDENFSSVLDELNAFQYLAHALEEPEMVEVHFDILNIALELDVVPLLRRIKTIAFSIAGIDDLCIEQEMAREVLGALTIQMVKKLSVNNGAKIEIFDNGNIMKVLFDLLDQQGASDEAKRRCTDLMLSLWEAKLKSLQIYNNNNNYYNNNEVDNSNENTRWVDMIRFLTEQHRFRKLIRDNSYVLSKLIDVLNIGEPSHNIEICLENLWMLLHHPTSSRPEERETVIRYIATNLPCLLRERNDLSNRSHQLCKSLSDMFYD